MKQQFKTRKLFYALSVAGFLFTACQKNADVTSTPATSGTTATTDASVSSTIAVVASANVATTDSVYVLQPCPRGTHRDSVAQNNLPAAVGTYLNANYAGYTFNKAFAIKDTSGTVNGYAVIIYYNNKPVGLEFDATGVFVKVLEQRERGDLSGPGFHHGGRFQHRDGEHGDSVALSALPAAALDYFSTNYSSDTLLKAYKNCDSGYVVLSKNNGLFATVFDASGTFVKRTSLAPNEGAPHGNVQEVAQTVLPANISTYLTTTYPNYVFDKAFVVNAGGAAAGYIVFIDANNTKYAVAFDATGAFIGAKTIY